MTKRRTHIGWGLIPLGISAALLLHALEIIPSGLFDLFTRAWPGLLVLVGLMLLLRGRIPLGSVAAFALSGVLVFGVAFTAYSSRTSQERTENQITIQQSISDEATLLVVNVILSDTDLTVRRGGGRGVSGQFSGSVESDIVTTFDTAVGLTVEYTLEQVQTTDFPSLEAVGRGAMTLDIPDEIAIALNVVVADGLVTLNLSDLQLERVTLDLASGDAAVTVPAYLPASLNPEERPNAINVRRGNLTLLVPNEIDARISFDRRGNNVPVQYDAVYIDQRDNVDGTLRREVESSEIRLFFDVTIPRGQLRLDVLRD